MWTRSSPPFNLIDRDAADDVLPWAREHEAGVIVYSPMASGLLTGAFTAESAARLEPGDWRADHPDFAESRTTYLPLVRFRSPLPRSSWVTALLAVLDSAALFLALSPESAPVVPARLCLRGEFQAFNRIARAMGIQVADEHDPQGGIGLSYQEFLDAVARRREVGFPIERDPTEAWPDFADWRINYEQAAYAVAAAVDAIPALWSSPRRHPTRPSARR